MMKNQNNFHGQLLSYELAEHQTGRRQVGQKLIFGFVFAAGFIFVENL